MKLPSLPRPRADWQVALAVVVFVLLLDNRHFWHLSVEELGPGRLGMRGFALSLPWVVLYLHLLPLLLMPGRIAMRVLATLMLAIGGGASHFIDTLGAPMTGEMMQNLLQTDTAEAADLISLGLVLRIVLLAMLPIALLWHTPMPAEPARLRTRRHALLAGGGLLLTAALVLPNGTAWADFLRGHRVLRAYLNPGAILVNLPTAAFAARHASTGPLQAPGPALRAGAARGRPRFVVLVVGETARAANFGLGGYARQTTPRLAARSDVVYFPRVLACGSSTAVSVPCLFSHLGHAGLRVKAAERYQNLLDLLQAAQVDVSWIDNNSGCKDVCLRVRTVQFPGTEPPGPDCIHAHCFDEVLLPPLQAELAAAADRARSPGSPDHLVVLHQIGSHGPAYHERVPPGADVFQPACATARIEECSREAIVNAYDNTIHYTDRVLADLIELLADPRWQALDTAMLYVSDHGESLGEEGLYLHGLPRAIAPDAQLHVPMLLWLSPSMKSATRVDDGCLRRRAVEPASHDDVFPTVLGLLGRADPAYRPARDRSARCAAAASG